MLIDTHCHPYMCKHTDIPTYIGNFKSAGGTQMISIGIDIETSKQSIELATTHPEIYTSIGIHPSDIGGLDLETTMKELERLYLANTEKVVAIGETGLDYYWIDQDEEYKKAPPEYQEKILVLRKELQRLFFIAQIRLAQTYNLPVVIHNRDAGTDTLEILKETNCQKFILHCFSEDLEFAKACIDFAPECMVSFSGIVTFQNAKDIQETAQHIPLKNIIIETDAPYLTPVPYRGKRENESALVAHVFEKICELRSESRDEIEKQIYENSRKIFRL